MRLQMELLKSGVVGKANIQMEHTWLVYSKLVGDEGGWVNLHPPPPLPIRKRKKWWSPVKIFQCQNLSCHW